MSAYNHWMQYSATESETDRQTERDREREGGRERGGGRESERERLLLPLFVFHLSEGGT